MSSIEAKNRARGAEKKQSRSLSSYWSAMAMVKNRGQPGGEGESKSSSREKKKKMGKSVISIGMSMPCGGSICSTKANSVLSRESRRSTSSRSLKAPGNGALVAAAGVSASSSSFNSEATAATTTTTTASVDSFSSTLSSWPLSSAWVSRSFRKLSGCYYECHSAAVDPRTSLGGGATMLSCADCGEFFIMAESLELHRATEHAVSELDAGDTSRNVVEIIFRSSWLTPPVCRIERILKVQSSGEAVERFEQYRERVKATAASDDDDPRCAADGNELLRFHRTTFRCSLGLAGATSLCRVTPPQPQRCELCGIIRDGFSADIDDGKIATSGRAHETLLPADGGGGGGEKRAMLVCRVVAGRVKKKVVVNGGTTSSADHCGFFDSVSSCSDSDELFVFNHRAILPCFVVIYSQN